MIEKRLSKSIGEISDEIISLATRLGKWPFAIIAGETESPIEELLLHELSKHLHRDTVVVCQQTIKTEWGSFRPDFLLRHDLMQLPISIECDGKEFHQDGLRDEFRDSVLLGECHVRDVLRFRGCDIWYHLEDCVYVIKSLFPCFFSCHGKAVVTDKASEEIRQWNKCGRYFGSVAYRELLAGGGVDIFSMEHLNKIGRQHWLHLYEFLLRRSGMRFNDVVAEYKSNLRS